MISVSSTNQGARRSFGEWRRPRKAPTNRSLGRPASGAERNNVGHRHRRLARDTVGGRAHHQRAERIPPGVLIGRPPPRRFPAQGGEQVAADQPGRFRHVAGQHRCCDDPGQLGVGGGHRSSRLERALPPPRLSLGDRHRRGRSPAESGASSSSSTTGSSSNSRSVIVDTTPRWRPSTAVRAVAASAWRSVTSAIWRVRSIS